MFLEFVHRFINLFLPPVCSLCGRVGEAQVTGSICRDCRRGFTPIRHPLCPSCGRQFFSGPDHLCGSCEQDQPFYDIARAGGIYRDTLLEAIQKLKYQGGVHLARELGMWLAQCWEEYGSGDPVDMVIPVPLHPRRIRMRRFNQSILLARVVSKRLGLPCDPLTLVRSRDTLPQVGLSVSERKKNVRDAFGICGGRGRLLKGTSILLIDDVMTTGATIGECARTLKKSGAAKVCVLTLARAE